MKSQWKHSLIYHVIFEKKWKTLALVLKVRDLTNDLVDERNQKLREKCSNMLLLWKQRFGPQATY